MTWWRGSWGQRELEGSWVWACSRLCGQRVSWLELTGFEWSPSYDLRVPGGNKGDWTTRLTLPPAPGLVDFQEQPGLGFSAQAPCKSLLALCSLLCHPPKKSEPQAQSQQRGALGNTVDSGSSLGPLLQQIHHDGWFKKWCWKDWIICGESSLYSYVEKWKC